MKTNFIGAVVLCAVISLTLGSEYQYQSDNNETCIEVKTDVKFTLTNGNETVKFDGSKFSVKSGECALSTETSAVLTLTTNNGDFLTLTFKYDLKDQTMMDAMFSFGPFEYFPSENSTVPFTTTIIDTGDLIMGSNTQLFQCISSQRMTLSGTAGDTTYTMYMDMSNTQIQAFGIKNGSLSSDG